MTPNVTAFFDEATNTISYVVKDPDSNAAAIIDSVLDYDQAAGRTDTNAADQIIAHVRQNKLDIQWLRKSLQRRH